ncbi:hypothetical protein CQ012_02445 [Arthrobacter sp. MYb214]|uniref:hypothetical protein n=1 Tax=Arthrobacter sp. MYb214 TaxID=1848596 RepID=UPI000CFB7A1B|nr:hypothetical protein [Arthrobacter sp. MYb214]PRB78268.1 hypothetical protein CQ012_02445 [Arthrobacter sp. MYb214]
MDSTASESFTLEIPKLADWLNLNQKEHWAPRNKRAQAWRHGAHIMARQAKLPKGLQRVQVDAYVWKKTRVRYDPHNLMPTLKPVIDGLVDCGLLVDDSSEYLVGPFVHHGGYGNEKLVLEIRSLEPLTRG